MNGLIIGASAGVGRALAEALAKQGWHLHLIASDPQDLSATTKDLGYRFGISATYTVSDLTAPDPAGLRAAVLTSFSCPDAIFFIAGAASDADLDKESVSDAEVVRLINVNFGSAVRIINAFLPDLRVRAHADIVAIGSVAAIRGRGRNMIYGSAKRGLEFYCEALRHLLADTGCRVQFYRLGFVRTSMLEGRPPPLPSVRPETVAKAIIRNLGHDRSIYVPGWWALVAVVLTLIPWRIFKKLDI